MPILFQEKCTTCGSLIDASKREAHVCYTNRNHDEDEIRPEIVHRTSTLKPGDMCLCGGLVTGCKHCGDTGRIS